MMKRNGRYLKGAALGTLGFCTSWAVSTRHAGPEWIEVVHVPLRFHSLPPSFRGCRIIQVSDLHCSRTVSGKYLQACIERVNRLQPDIVLLTGDYITYDYYGRFRRKVVNVISAIRSRHGVLACLGNHDYGVIGGCMVADRMAAELQDCGVSVLRNQSMTLRKGSDRISFVGLGDIWADDFQPGLAFKNVTAGEAVIVLSHNPESAELLHNYRADAVLSGHTHGMRLGVRKEKGRHRIALHNYRRGMYKVDGKKLYVNRGLGRHGKMFYNSRPEITVFSLC